MFFDPLDGMRRAHRMKDEGLCFGTYGRNAYVLGTLEVLKYRAVTAYYEENGEKIPFHHHVKDKEEIELTKEYYEDSWSSFVDHVAMSLNFQVYRFFYPSFWFHNEADAAEYFIKRMLPGYKYVRNAYEYPPDSRIPGTKWLEKGLTWEYVAQYSGHWHITGKPDFKALMEFDADEYEKDSRSIFGKKEYEPFYDRNIKMLENTFSKNWGKKREKVKVDLGIKRLMKAEQHEIYY